MPRQTSASSTDMLQAHARSFNLGQQALLKGWTPKLVSICAHATACTCLNCSFICSCRPMARSFDFSDAIVMFGFSKRATKVLRSAPYGRSAGSSACSLMMEQSLDFPKFNCYAPHAAIGANCLRCPVQTP